MSCRNEGVEIIAGYCICFGYYVLFTSTKKSSTASANSLPLTPL